MISLLQSQCEHWEGCKAKEFHDCPCMVLRKRHEPAADLGARWAQGRPLGRLGDDERGGSGDAD